MWNIHVTKGSIWKTGGKAMGLSAQMNIFLCDALIQDYDDELKDLSRTKQLRQKQMNSEIQEINWDYTQEERLIRNEIKTVDNKTDEGLAQYKELMAELQELEEEQSMKTSVLEDELHNIENTLEVQQGSIEDSRNFVQKTRDGLEEMVNDHIERSAYFVSN